MKRSLFEHATGLTALVLFALFAAFSPVSAKPGGKGGGGDKPGGGGGEEPPPNPAHVEYQLTWFPGTYGYTEIHDINSAGIAVGRYHDETGARRLFWTTADGTINPLDDWWVLPPGYEDWQVEGGELQINNAHDVCGFIENTVTGEEELFLANLFDVSSLEPVGSVPSNSQWLHMNENGDVVFMAAQTGWYSLLYVRSLNTIFNFEQDYPGYMPTGINDNLQVSLILSGESDGTGLVYHGSARLTFDPANESAMVEELGFRPEFHGSGDSVLGRNQQRRDCLWVLRDHCHEEGQEAQWRCHGWFHCNRIGNLDGTRCELAHWQFTVGRAGQGRVLCPECE